jgi:hypothetical protein
MPLDCTLVRLFKPAKRNTSLRSKKDFFVVLKTHTPQHTQDISKVLLSSSREHTVTEIKSAHTF